jgi:hypothetical protein
MWKANGKTTTLLLFLDSLSPKTENSVWKRPWTCRETDLKKNVVIASECTQEMGNKLSVVKVWCTSHSSIVSEEDDVAPLRIGHTHLRHQFYLLLTREFTSQQVGWQ